MGKCNMKKTIFLSLLLFCYLPSSLAKEKYQVCSITINSSDEINTFKDHLSERDFNFVELVPLGIEGTPNNAHWFNRACEDEKYRCDILVISGHFGGLFFGENHSRILPGEMMQKQSCSSSCGGILSNVKEVFLFGSNTMAQKGRDQRTPEEYLDVLLDHNMIRDIAETVVASRYLPYGLSFREQMELIFYGQTNIYGFDSLIPPGKHIRGSLNNYFRSINQKYGDYASYLEQLQSGKYNSLIHKTIGGNITQGHGLSRKHPKFSSFQKMCPLFQDSLDNYEGLQIVKDLFHSGEGVLAFSAIKNFISSRSFSLNKNVRIFTELKNDRTIKKEFVGLYGKISEHSPYAKIQFLTFLNSFGWITNSLYKKDLRRYALKIVGQPTSEAYDFSTALIYNEKIDPKAFDWLEDDFDQDFYQNIWSPLIIESLDINNYLVHRRLINLCIEGVRENNHPAQEDLLVCYQVLKTLGHLDVSDPITVEAIAKLLNVKSFPGLLFYAMYALGHTSVKDVRIHREIAKHANYNDTWVSLQVVRTLRKLKSSDLQAYNNVKQLVERTKNDELFLESLQTLYIMESSSSTLKKGANSHLSKHTNRVKDIVSQTNDEELLLKSLETFGILEISSSSSLAKIIKQRQLIEHPRKEIREWARSFI